MKKLSFDKQILLGLAFLALMHICSWVFKQGIFINVGGMVYGLLFIIHPVVPDRAKGIKNIQIWIRLAGLLCVVIGVITKNAV